VPLWWRQVDRRGDEGNDNPRLCIRVDVWLGPGASNRDRTASEFNGAASKRAVFHQQAFSNIVTLTGQLERAHITAYHTDGLLPR
jgi:hypothetical protein